MYKFVQAYNPIVSSNSLRDLHYVKVKYSHAKDWEPIDNSCSVFKILHNPTADSKARAINRRYSAVLGILIMAPTAVYDPPPITSSSKDATPIQAMSHGPTIPGIPSFKDLEEKREWQLEHMAGAFRVFARHGYTEGMSGHISVRDPIQRDAFWMNPLGVHFGMLKASDMILVNLNGDIVKGRNNRPVNAAGFLIHAAIHRARPDVRPIGLSN